MKNFQLAKSYSWGSSCQGLRYLQYWPGKQTNLFQECEIFSTTFLCLPCTCVLFERSGHNPSVRTLSSNNRDLALRFEFWTFFRSFFTFLPIFLVRT